MHKPKIGYGKFRPLDVGGAAYHYRGPARNQVKICIAYFVRCNSMALLTAVEDLLDSLLTLSVHFLFANFCRYNFMALLTTVEDLLDSLLAFYFKNHYCKFRPLYFDGAAYRCQGPVGRPACWYRRGCRRTRPTRWMPRPPPAPPFPPCNNKKKFNVVIHNALWRQLPKSSLTFFLKL